MTINDACARAAFMIRTEEAGWGGGVGGGRRGGAGDHKKKREKENTGLVGNCGSEWWERERMGKTLRPDV